MNFDSIKMHGTNGGGNRKDFNLKNDNSTSVAAAYCTWTGPGHRNYSENASVLACDATSVGEYRIIVPPSAGK